MLNLTKIYTVLLLQALLVAPLFMACSRDDDDDCQFSSYLIHADYTAIENSVIASDKDPFFGSHSNTQQPFRQEFQEFLALDITFQDTVLSREKLVNHSLPWGPSQAWACQPSEEKYEFARSVDTILVELLGDTSTSSYNPHFEYFLDIYNPGIKAPSMSAALEENKRISPQIRTIRCVVPIRELPVGKELAFKTTVAFNNDEVITAYSKPFLIE